MPSFKIVVRSNRSLKNGPFLWRPHLTANPCLVCNRTVSSAADCKPLNRASSKRFSQTVILCPLRAGTATRTIVYTTCACADRFDMRFVTSPHNANDAIHIVTNESSNRDVQRWETLPIPLATEPTRNQIQHTVYIGK